MPGKEKPSKTRKLKAPAAGKKKTLAARKAAPVSGTASMIVTLSGDRSIHEVAKDLKAHGFVVEGLLEAIGSVTGRAHPRTLEKLRAIRGVADVSGPHPDFDIGEPGAIS
jgi:hypothetical protein